MISTYVAWCCKKIPCAENRFEATENRGMLKKAASEKFMTRSWSFGAFCLKCDDTKWVKDTTLKKICSSDLAGVY